jgi:hypothetical protein
VPSNLAVGLPAFRATERALASAAGTFVSVPSRRQRATPRAPSTRKRARITAAAVVVLVAVGIGYLALRTSPRLPIQPTGCVAGPSSQAVFLNPGQAGIAATIAGVASARSMPTRAVAIAYATAWQESKLTDLDYGTLDSVGVFQQRPSEGWGTARQIENPVYATGRFFQALALVPRYRKLPIAVAAQDVQHSADGSAYAQYAAAGTAMARAFTGVLPHAVWCSYGAPVGKARLLAARRALTSAFGSLAGSVAPDPSVRVTVSSPQQGWAVASWLVAHAASYGIQTVRYQSYRWLAASSGRWRVLTASHGRRPAASAAVVFG